MKKVFLVTVSIIFTLTLYSCSNTSHKIEPIKTEVIDFDIQTAVQMIEKGEKIIADMSVKDTVSRQEFNQFLSDIIDAYGGYEDQKWEYMFFYNNEFQDERIEALHLNREMFYPTMYHEDVEVVSAQITNTYYQDEYEFLNNNILTITEEYLGEDSKLEGWYRQYHYRKNDEGKWVFYHFGGQMNFLGEGFTSDYLGLK